MPKFTVDTHLFRELGELLVGRDSTALIELIKNAYDADATSVMVHGTDLHRVDHGRIEVHDNGNGMDLDTFRKGFLRVASRMKEQGNQRSTFYRRRYTGAKGIGRLAAHKLARRLTIASVPRQKSNESVSSISATIDWDQIEMFETLDDLEQSSAIIVSEEKVPDFTSNGTILILSRLRKAWTLNERERFITDVRSFSVPPFLRDPLPESVITRPMLFKSPITREESSEDTQESNQFEVSLSGDFSSGEDYWQFFTAAANWVIEIRSRRDQGQVNYAIEPTTRTLVKTPMASGYRTSVQHPFPDEGPHFDARILVREGHTFGKQDQRVWALGSSGIRVFLEGFRVLPYGDRNDDWLSIDADYTRRPRQLEMLRNLDVGLDETDSDEGLTRLPSNNYAGAVFLTQDGCRGLRLLVNREGFVPEAGFHNLVNLVRTGVDLCTRVRARASYEDRKLRSARRRRQAQAQRKDGGLAASVLASTVEDRKESFVSIIEDAAGQLSKARSRLAAGEHEAAISAAGEGERILAEVKLHAKDMMAERSLLWVLASVGTQMSAFVHEINALLGTAHTIEAAVERCIKDLEDPSERHMRRRLVKIRSAIASLKLGLERQASYLLDITTPDARRRRSRQPLGERFDAAARLVRQQAERRGVEIVNSISTSLKSPPLFRAELTTIFSNLLTNAIKAAGENGCIRGSASDDSGRLRIRVENTGQAVDIKDAERWFKPFESTTSEVDPVLGQGMGLGLTITRYVLESYGAQVSFVEPSESYATAIEVAFPQGDD